MRGWLADSNTPMMRIFQNFGFLSGGKLLGDLFTFLLFVALSRTFGQEGLGQYSVAMAFGGFLLILSDFGLYPYSVKEMSRLKDDLPGYYGRILTLRLVLSAAVVLLMLAVVPWLPFPFEQKLIIIILGMQQILYSLVDGFSAVFVAREQMHLAGFLEFSLRALGALVSIAVIFVGGSLAAALLMLPLVTLLQVLLAYWMVRRLEGKLVLGISREAARQTLQETLPFGMSRLLGQVATRLDILLLGFILGAAAAGIYNAAYRVVFMLMFISYFASMALFPEASRLYAENVSELKKFYHRSMNLIILGGLPLAAGIWLIAPALVQLIYGDQFAQSGYILRFLAWLVLIAFLNNTLGMFLTASDRQAERTKVQWAAAVVNGVGNLVLIPLLGILGAALATLFSEGLLVVLLLWKLKGVLGLPRVASRMWMSTAAAAGFSVPFFFFFSSPLYVVVPASAAIYTGVLFLFKDIRAKEGRFLMSALQRKKPLES
jgi:O-antigen/teichoic acid export membrane protein